jgi:acetyl esterase/lipase
MRTRTTYRLWITAVALIFLLTFFTGCAKRGGAGANALRSTSDVTILKDIAYRGGESFDKDKHILDLYIPKGEKNFPVIFFVHGGAWMVGDKTATAQVGMVYAQRGIGVVNVNYRLFPGVSYPRFAEDVARAFSWTVDNIKDYGGDPDNIFVMGHSAGAHLAALVSTNDRFLKKHGLSPNDIVGTIGVSGAYRIQKGFYPRVFAGGSDVRKDASPYNHVSGSTPPFLLLFATADMQEAPPQAREMHDQLRSKNVPSRLVKCENRNHGSILNMMGGSGDEATREVLDFIRKWID